MPASPETIKAWDRLGNFSLQLLMWHGQTDKINNRLQLTLPHANEHLAAKRFSWELEVPLCAQGRQYENRPLSINLVKIDPMQPHNFERQNRYLYVLFPGFFGLERGLVHDTPTDRTRIDDINVVNHLGARLDAAAQAQGVDTGLLLLGNEPFSWTPIPPVTGSGHQPQ
jgi:hypothetical protein